VFAKTVIVALLGSWLLGAMGAQAAPIEVVAFTVRATPDSAFPDPGIELALAFADGSAFVPDPGAPFVGVGTNFRATDPIGSFVLRSAANEPDFTDWAILLTNGMANNGEGGDGIREFWIRARLTTEGTALNAGFMQSPGFFFNECQFFTSLGAQFGAGACDPGDVDLQGFDLSGVRFELLAVSAPGAPLGALDLGVTILAIPEPSTATLFLIALSVLAIRGRQQRRFNSRVVNPLTSLCRLAPARRLTSRCS
jgi:hypothetical protein